MHFAISTSWGPTDTTRAMLPFIFAASPLQVNEKVNKMFLQVKKNEKVETKTIPNTLKKKEEPKIEIIKDKINIFNELDIININN